MPSKRTVPRTCQWHECGKEFLAIAYEVNKGWAKYCCRDHKYKGESVPRSSVSERFWSKVDKTPGQGPKGECWTWKASTNRKGYGRFGNMLAHRFAWEQEHGPLPDGQCALHACDNPPCVRCLFRGSKGDNNLDMTLKGRHWSKLTVDNIREIKRYLALGVTQKTLAYDFHVNQTLISAIKRGTVWSHVSPS